MRFLFALLALIAVAACCPEVETNPIGTGDSGGSTTTATFTCDLPDGPPPFGIDPYCLDQDNAGQVCCRQPEDGVCQGNECAECGAQSTAFNTFSFCWQPTCCDTAQATLDAMCMATEPYTPVAVTCSFDPLPYDQTDERHCVKAAPITCAWGGEAAELDVWCCEP